MRKLLIVLAVLLLMPVVTGQVDFTKVIVAWDQVTTDVQGNPETVGGYTIYCEVTAAVGSPTPATPSTNAVIKVVGPTEYTGVDIYTQIVQLAGTTKPYKIVRVWVDCFDAAGNHSDYSNYVDIDPNSAKPPDTTPPKPPTDLQVKRNT